MPFGANIGRSLAKAYGCKPFAFKLAYLGPSFFAGAIGALGGAIAVIALRNPGRYRSVSAFAPIVAPLQVPWGEKAFACYLGPDRAAWRRHDAVALIEDGARLSGLLVDQGEADDFLAEQLKPQLLERACADTGIPLELRMRPGYDHSYYFISTFMAGQLAWHADRLDG